MNRRAVMKGSLGLGAGLLMGCGSSATSGVQGTQARSTTAASPGPRPAKVLVAYFSRPGENYHYGGRRDLDVGNTEIVANMIASAVDVDLYRITAAEPYPHDYEETVQRNKQEQVADARPAIAGRLPAVANYDTVLLGSPIWNVRPPMIMRTFVDDVDLGGKRVHPFVTYAVSGMGATVEDYTAACPDSSIGEGLAVQGEEAHGAQTAVQDWLQRIGLRATA